MTEYTLYKFEDGGYCVRWYDEVYELEFGQDSEDGEVYAFSDWVERPENEIGTFNSLNDAWWAALIDRLTPDVPTDPRLHPCYSYKYKAIV